MASDKVNPIADELRRKPRHAHRGRKGREILGEIECFKHFVRKQLHRRRVWITGDKISLLQQLGGTDRNPYKPRGRERETLLDASRCCKGTRKRERKWERGRGMFNFEPPRDVAPRADSFRLAIAIILLNRRHDPITFLSLAACTCPTVIFIPRSPRSAGHRYTG